MKTITRFLKRLGLVCLTLLGAFFVYANWEAPPMHARVKPVRLVVYELGGLSDSLSARQLEQVLARTGGVSAAVVNHHAKLMSLSFYEDQISESALRRLASQQGQYQVRIPNYGAIEASGPQCPVPMSYIQTFERIKYAFCIR